MFSSLRENFPLFSSVYLETQNAHTMNTLPEYLGGWGGGCSAKLNCHLFYLHLQIMHLK